MPKCTAKIETGIYKFDTNSQRARKFKKVTAKKRVKSNKSKKTFREIAFSYCVIYEL